MFTFGGIDPTTVLIRVGGPPGSGKSTFVDSVLVGQLSRLFRWESQADRGDSDLDRRTRGLRCEAYTDEHSARFVFMDLGGQASYFPGHQTIISSEKVPSINAILLPAIASKATLSRAADRWATFFACKAQPSAARRPLLILASREDKATDAHRRNVLKVAADLQKKFKNYFSFPYDPFFLDMRKSGSRGMGRLRKALSCLHKQVLLASHIAIMFQA